MNKLIALKELVDMLAQAAGVSQEIADAYVRAFSVTVRDALATGEMVRIKGVGIFSTDPETHNISFVPDSQLAEEANAPFSFFEAVPLNPGVTEDVLAEASPEPVEVAPDPVEAAPKPTEAAPEPEPDLTNPPTPSNLTEEITPEPVEAPEPEPDLTNPPTPSNLTEEITPEPVEAPETEPDLTHSPTPSNLTEEITPEPQESANNPGWMWMIWAAVVGLLVGFAIGYFAHDPIQEAFEPALAEYPESEVIVDLDESDELTQIDDQSAISDLADKSETADQSEKTAQSDKTEQPQKPEPSTEPGVKSEQASAQVTEVYDEVRQNYFLANMSKKHYGYKDFWVYIYEENRDKISNPNLINIGTKLRIAPLEKYATLPTLEENLAAARKKAVEIQDKYDKK